ncbi:MAG: competence/damage-inducible protein A [Candidatus Eisenbacteria bacterium]|nr:competence/damage-inducible protein A [Candidatus Eisenbacteria bacterium]
MSIAHLLIIGNEVLSGEVADLNIQFLTRRLTGLGTRVRSVRVVPDEDEAIVSAIRQTGNPDSPLLVTGGIGPTHDDRTRAAVAMASGLELVRHAEAEERLRAGYGPGLNEVELEMAMLPAGARLSLGPRSGVFGFVINRIYVFPGVPDLLADVFESVADEFVGRPDHRIEITTTLKEGNFARALGALATEYPDVAIGSYPTRGATGWLVRLILRGPDSSRVEAAAAHVREFTRADA